MAKQLNINAPPYKPQKPLPAVVIRVSPPPPPPLPAICRAPYILVYPRFYSESGLSWTYSFYRPSPASAPALPTACHCVPVTKSRCLCPWKPKSSISCGGGGCDTLKTTVMIKNIPNQLRRKKLVQFLDKLCKVNNLEYDFVYLPMDFKLKNNYGYAFVNFTSAAAATRIKELLQGYKWGRIQTDFGHFLSHKVCDITWANIQGRDALIRNFENKTYSCGKKEWLPVVFAPPRNGFKRASKQKTIGKCSNASSSGKCRASSSGKCKPSIV